MSKELVINDEITECGLRYIGHFNHPAIMIYGDSWGIEIPENRLREFTNLFPDINWDSGEFLHKLIGRYVRITYDENFNILSISHIVKDIHYTVKERDKNEF